MEKILSLRQKCQNKAFVNIAKLTELLNAK